MLGAPRAGRGWRYSVSELSRTLGFRRVQRLGATSISAILSSGRRFKAGAISVQIRGNGLGYARLGLIVPKKYLPSAVDRNRLKRRTREWFRLHQERMQSEDILVRLIGAGGANEKLVDDLSRLVLERR